MILTGPSQPNNQQTASVTRYYYNALGQLERKTVGGQTVTHQYNPRGWLAKASSPFFSYSLSYEAPHDRTRSQYNGNISEQIWMTGEGRTPYRYGHAYDPANRLTAGISADGYGESMQYDKMGNITSLVRTGQPLIPGGAGSFAYSYGTQGNRLQSVTNGGNYIRSYQYNDQGSMVSDGQIKVIYNEVGLPKEITDMGNVPKISYLYDASGRKLRRIGTTETRHYIGGIEYTGSGSGATIDLVHTAGGITRRSGSNYVYEYFLQDHLGNNRVIYNSSGAVLQQTDYYPFGMAINRKVTSPKMPYTYNGKELQEEIGQYDYGARFYDPEIGRWNVVDPLSEQMRKHSPYNYAFNNPIRFIDPDGMRPDDYTVTDEGKIELVRRTDDSFDRLIKVDDSGTETSTSIKVDKGVLRESPKSVLNDSPSKMFDDYTIMQTSNNTQAVKLFEFLSNNTSVEWGKISMIGGSIVSTSHDKLYERSSGSILLSLMNNGFFMNSRNFIMTQGTVLDHVHSHPNSLELGASGNYGKGGSSRGDRYFAEKVEAINPNLPLRIYHIKTGGVYFRYNSRQNLIR